MKICQPHWESLKAAIHSRGLDHLIAVNDRDAHARTVAELKGTAEADDFDPLMGAHNMIVGKCTELLGIGLFMGDFCPLCEILKPGVYPQPAADCRYKSNESYFIDGPADAVLQMARERGLAA